jgi:hypothetical protein
MKQIFKINGYRISITELKNVPVIPTFQITISYQRLNKFSLKVKSREDAYFKVLKFLTKVPL